MEKFSASFHLTHLLTILVSLLSSPFGSFLDNQGVVENLDKSVLVHPLFDFEIESPFVDAYGIYYLPDSSIEEYLESIPLEFSYSNSSILVKAPYLIYQMKR